MAAAPACKIVLQQALRCRPEGARLKSAVRSNAAFGVHRAPQSRQIRQTVPMGVGKDVVEGWLDLAKLVSSSSGSKTAYETLASQIGKDVYADMNGWHLYLRDMNGASGFKMSQVLAQQIGSQASGGKGVSSSDIEGLLKKVPVKLGGGKVTVSLFEVVPSAGISDLVRASEDWARDQ